MSAAARIPLTPALSQREREKRWKSFGMALAVVIYDASPAIPSALGEGNPTGIDHPRAQQRSKRQLPGKNNVP